MAFVVFGVFFPKPFQVSLLGEECRRHFLNIHTRIFLRSDIIGCRQRQEVQLPRDRRYNCQDKERLDRQTDREQEKNVDLKHDSSRKTSRLANRAKLCRIML